MTSTDHKAPRYVVFSTPFCLVPLAPSAPYSWAPLAYVTS